MWMLLRLQVTSVNGNAGGPKLVVMRPAPAVDPNNDPNKEWTAEGGKPQAELRVYVSNPELADDFVQGNVVDVEVSTGSVAPAPAARAVVSTAPASTPTPTGTSSGSTTGTGGSTTPST